MRGKNRKPIASCLKLPQFTTMNVIDGQAGLILYASLIFCSLTIDNILNIIVLLILAAVSIATLTGENGILNQASKAVEKNKQATEEEQRNLAKIEARMNTENTTFQNVTIPAGFAPTKIEGESTVDEGLVIIDEEGNEFVWVPVPDISKFKRVVGYSNGGKQSNWAETNYKEPYISGYSTEETEYEKMYESVKTNGGFYIGRYEAGKDENGNVVVQKNVNVYNIKWGNAMDDEAGGAVEKSKEFKKGKAYEDSVTSTLIYGIQWDATMQFFDSNYINGTCDSENSYVSNSTGKGNYNEDANKNEWKNQVTKTGILPNYAIKNIYDMAGNLWEWTMEAWGTNLRVLRGGSFHYTGFTSPASGRTNNDPFYSDGNIGFRIALYIV